jgi:hypothetical protein
MVCLDQDALLQTTCLKELYTCSGECAITVKWSGERGKINPPITILCSAGRHGRPEHPAADRRRLPGGSGNGLGAFGHRQPFPLSGCAGDGGQRGVGRPRLRSDVPVEPSVSQLTCWSRRWGRYPLFIEGLSTVMYSDRIFPDEIEQGQSIMDSLLNRVSIGSQRAGASETAKVGPVVR